MRYFPIVSYCFWHIDMVSGFLMPFGIAKTLMTTRDVLFTRYAIKCILIPVRWRNRKFFHLFLFKLRLVHILTSSEIFFVFSAGVTTQFLPLLDAIVFVQDLWKIRKYSTHSRYYLRLLSIEQGKKYSPWQTFLKDGDSLRYAFHETRI